MLFAKCCLQLAHTTHPGATVPRSSAPEQTPPALIAQSPAHLLTASPSPLVSLRCLRRPQALNVPPPSLRMTDRNAGKSTSFRETPGLHAVRVDVAGRAGPASCPNQDGILRFDPESPLDVPISRIRASFVRSHAALAFVFRVDCACGEGLRATPRSSPRGEDCGCHHARLAGSRHATQMSSAKCQAATRDEQQCSTVLNNDQRLRVTTDTVPRMALLLSPPSPFAMSRIVHGRRLSSHARCVPTTRAENGQIKTAFCRLKPQSQLKSWNLHPA